MAIDQNIFRRRVSINPAVTASSAYAAGNQVGPTSTKLAGVLEGPAHISYLQSIVVVDAAAQGSALDFLFFSTQPTVSSSDKSAYTITAAEVKAKFLGSVSVASGDYVATAGQKLATKSNLKMFVQSLQDTNNLGKDLFVSIVCRGTPTFAATTDLVVDFGFE